jgi:hypothetical protein
MKRNEIVEKLINEGFSEKTLVNFTDKQLSELSSRILGEQVTPMPPKQPALKIGPKGGELPPNQKGYTISQNPVDKTIIAVAKESQVSEEKPSAGLSKEKKSEVVKKAKKGEDIGKKGKGFEKVVTKAKESGAKDPEAVAAAAMWKNVKRENTEVKDWLETIAESNFHSFTSKNEIMELIKVKINEVEVGPNVKKGHNGIPEFMSYDAISNTDVKEAAPTTKPAPTKPKVEPGTKPKTPYQPGPGKDPKPKALKEKENANK